jgi:hypothetical protein
MAGPKKQLSQHEIGWGTTRYTARVLSDGELTRIQLETKIQDARRLQILLHKLLSAAIRIEDEVSLMTDEQIANYVGTLTNCLFENIKPKT